MVYMFIDIDRLGIKIRQVVSAIEKGIIDWLFGKGIVATCVQGAPGVFVRSENGAIEKIAAIGLNFSRGISMHGFALYLLDDSEPFSLINPCGVKGGQVTSVQAQLSEALSPKECFESVANHIRSSIFSNAKWLDEVDSCDR
jgi:lipoyl(octanoyl) transferase